MRVARAELVWTSISIVLYLLAVVGLCLDPSLTVLGITALILATATAFTRFQLLAGYLRRHRPEPTRECGACGKCSRCHAEGLDCESYQDDDGMTLRRRSR